MKPLIQSKRDERALAWLIEQVGESAVAAACLQLAGNRKAYPSNLARALGLILPNSLALASPADVKRHIAEIEALLEMKQ